MSNPTQAVDDQQSQGVMISVPVAASTKIYAGSQVSVNASGYAVIAGDTASTKFLGSAADTVDNSAGADGDKRIAVYVRGTFRRAFQGTATQAAVGQRATVYDGQTVALAATTTNDIDAGLIVEFVDASTVRVLY